MSEDHLKKHYADLSAKPFFPGLVKYMASGPVLAMVWEGLNVVATGRVMLGETNPKDSKPGTIRGDFCIQVGILEDSFISQADLTILKKFANSKLGCSASLSSDHKISVQFSNRNASSVKKNSGFICGVATKPF